MCSLLAVLLAACGGGDEINELRQKTNHVEIVSVDSMGRVINSRSFDDRNEIKKVLSVVSESEAPTFECGHNYELLCRTKDNKIVVIEINSNNEYCASASFVYNGKLMTRYLDNEGLKHIENLIN